MLLLLLCTIPATGLSEACQRSPSDVRAAHGVSGKLPAMHVEYPAWNRSDVLRTTDHSIVFSWQYRAGGGTIHIGSSFATAATCFLRRVAVWPRLHLTQADNVAAEVHLEHDCLSGNATAEQAESQALLAELYAASISNVSAAQGDLDAALASNRWCAVAETTCGGCRDAKDNFSSTNDSVTFLTLHLQQMQELCRLLAHGPGVEADKGDKCIQEATVATRRLGSLAGVEGCEAHELMSWPSLRGWHDEAGGYRQAVEKHTQFVRSLQKRQEDVDEYAFLEANYHKEMKLDRAVLVKQVIMSDDPVPQHPLVHFILLDNASVAGHEAVFGVDDQEATDALHYRGTHIGMECQEGVNVDWFLLPPARTDPRSHADVCQFVRSNSSLALWRAHPEWLFAHSLSATHRLAQVPLTQDELLPPRYSQRDLVARRPLFLAIIGCMLLALPVILDVLMMMVERGTADLQVSAYLCVTLVVGTALLLLGLAAPYTPFFSCLEFGWRWWMAFPLPFNAWHYPALAIQFVLTLGRFIVCLLLAVVSLLPMVLYPAYVWPVVAYVGRRANCIDGIDWEVHVAFAVCLMANAGIFSWVTWEGGIYPARWTQRVMEYGKYLLQNVDIYTDLIFVNIAVACHTHYGTPSLWLFMVGVVGCQWLLPSLVILAWGCFGQRSPRSRGVFLILAFQLLQLPCPSFAAAASSAKLGTHLLRITFEDLPQLYLQYRFTMTVKKNPLIIFSMVTSLMMACGSLALSYKEACLPGHRYELAVPDNKWWDDE